MPDALWSVLDPRPGRRPAGPARPRPLAGPGAAGPPLRPPGPARRHQPHHRHRPPARSSAPTTPRRSRTGSPTSAAGTGGPSVCPSCSHEYKGDVWHVLMAGAAGGMKDVPDTVAAHPLVFATLTAPSFGPVHTAKKPGRPGTRRCRPRTGDRRQLCPHGRPLWCMTIHDHADRPGRSAAVCRLLRLPGPSGLAVVGPGTVAAVHHRPAPAARPPPRPVRDRGPAAGAGAVRQGRRVPTARRHPLPRPDPARRPARPTSTRTRPRPSRSTAATLADLVRTAAGSGRVHRPAGRRQRPAAAAAVRRPARRPTGHRRPPTGRTHGGAAAPGDGRGLHRQVRHQSRGRPPDRTRRRQRAPAAAADHAAAAGRPRRVRRPDRR